MNKLAELRQLAFDRQPHIIAITESWLKPEIGDSELNIDGYSTYRSDSLRGSTGGATIYVYESLPVPLTLDFPQLRMVDTLWIKLSLRNKDSLLIGLVYRSPSSTAADDERFLPCFRKMIDASQWSHLLLLGDFNLPKIDWPQLRSHEEGFSESLVRLIQKRTWFQHVKEPTRYRPGNLPSLLDLVISNEAHFVDVVHHHPPLGHSDHLLLSFDYICYWTLPTASHTTLRCFCKANFTGLRCSLTAFKNVISGSSINNVDQLNKLVTEHILAADEQFIPRVPKNSSTCPPLPKSIRRLLEKRSRLFALYISSGSSDILDEFRSTRNQCKTEIRNHRQNKQKCILEAARTNKGVVYQYMNRLRKNKPSALALQANDGTPISDPEDVSKIFKDCYATIFSQDGSNVQAILPDQPFDKELKSAIFTVHDVWKQLLSTNPYSAMGPDQIHPRILKETASELAPTYFKLFSQSLECGALPQLWKKATVIPIFKNGARHSPSNYRPISLTSIPCKIMERLVKRNLLDHLQRNKLISRAQHGFVPYRSCITNLLLFMDSLTNAFDQGLITDAVFFDFSKAFDRVPHTPLLQKLYAYGIRGNLLNWIKDFLHNRTFHVKVGASKSEDAPVNSGVPQGSVLGPLLFLVYINDLPQQLDGKCLLFADDLKIWNPNDPSQLQMDVDSVKRWSEEWGLPINEEKCAHVSFGGESGNAFYFLNDDPPSLITKKDIMKDLGVILASNMSLSLHHESISKKGFALVNQLKRAFPTISRMDFKFLYGTYVRPSLEYASQVVASGLKKDVTVIERVQRRATKMVVGLKNVAYEHRLQELSLYPLDMRRLRGDLFYTFVQFLQGKEDQLFALADNNSLRGHHRKLFKRHARTSVRLNFLAFRVVSLWNDLPGDVVSATSKDQFKIRLDSWLGLNKLRGTKCFM